METNQINYFIASKIQIRNPRQKIILIVGPCRSGTTAHLRVFAQDGIVSYHQPLKSILRAKLQGVELSYNFPDKQIFIKEALGPYTLAESIFDPLAVLLKAGVAPSSIRLIMMVRDPWATVTSWLQVFAFHTDKGTLVKNFIKAYCSVHKIRKDALVSGVETTTLVYEAFRDYTPIFIMEKLFERLELPFSEEILSGWNTLSSLKSPKSSIFLPIGSKLDWYSGHNIHKKVESSRGFFYNDKPISVIKEALSSKHIQAILTGGLHHIYDEFRVACNHEFNIAIPLERSKL